jgi:hypothetical protein
VADENKFDGQNPVPGYTLFHGKDGKSYYLKGENLADADITQRVQKLRGTSAPPAAEPAPVQPRSPDVFDATASSRPAGSIADALSAKLGGYIAGRDTSALRAGNPNAVAGSIPRMAKTGLDYARSATTPEGGALTAGLLLAHTNPYTAALADMALATHGGFNALSNAPEALSGNPEALESALLSGSEALGGAAGMNRSIPAGRAAIARQLYNADQVFKPGVSTGARIVGGSAGSLTGGAIGSIAGPAGTYGGAAGGGAAGAALGPRLLEKAFPPPPTYPGASLPLAEEFYANRAKELAARGVAQGALDRRAAIAARALKPDPFAGMTPTNVPIGTATLPEVPQGNPTPFSTPHEIPGINTPIVRRASARSALSPTPIITDIDNPIDAARIGYEGRPATWRNQRVEELARRGNRQAIAQTALRGEELPPNARYVMGDPDFPRAVYNPRETTRFTPEGTPIRDTSNPSIISGAET